MQSYHVKIIVVSVVGIQTETQPEAVVAFQTKRSELMKTREYERSFNPFWCEEFPCTVQEGEEVVFKLLKASGKELGSARLIIPHLFKSEITRHKLPLENGGMLTVKIICEEIEKKEEQQ